MTEEKIEAVRASDLLMLMHVVQHATALWNSLEAEVDKPGRWDNLALEDTRESYENLKQALQVLGLAEV